MILTFNRYRDLRVVLFQPKLFGVETCKRCWSLIRSLCVCLQVWDVTFTKPVAPRNASEPHAFATTAVARLTLLVGLPGPETAREGNERLMAIAKSLEPSDEISMPGSKL